MITLEGRYFDGQKPVAQPAKLDFEGQEARLSTEGVSALYSADRLKVSPRTGGAERFIALPDKAQFLCRDSDFLDELPQESPSEGLVAWLEQRWGIALAGVVITACLLLLGYFYGLPAVARRVAERIPVATEQAIARETLRWFEGKWFTPTTVEKSVRQEIQHGFDTLVSDLPLKQKYRLEFRASRIGANAFALPGGTIIITDDMVRTAKTTEEVLSVLAHETGHVELHHTMRSVLQGSVVAVAVATITADAATLSGVVAGLPVVIMDTKYSRAFEAEADDYAFQLLRQKGLSPAAFASIMERISEKSEGKNRFAFLSTHPLTQERIARARNAAGK